MFELSEFLVLCQCVTSIPESTSEVALGFTNGGMTLGALSRHRRARGYTRQSLTFDAWNPSYVVASNPFYQIGATHTPAVLPFTGPQFDFWTTAGLASATRGHVHIAIKPTFEWSIGGGYLRTAHQTGHHTLGPIASMTRVSENTNVIQTNLTRTFGWIAERGTPTSPPHISRCILNAETAKPDCTDTALDLSLFSEIQSVMFRPHSNVVYVTAVDAATGTPALYYVILDANTGLPSSPSLSKVVFSDGSDHQLNWVFSAPGDTDVFYAASSRAVYGLLIQDSSNPGTATIRDIELARLPAGALTTQPQIFTQPAVWQQRAGLVEDRDAKRLKKEYHEELAFIVLGQGDTASMCRGTPSSSAWSCWGGVVSFGADITAISAPTSFTWQWDVQGAQVRPTVDFVFGFGTPVPGYDTTLLGCSILFPQKMDEDLMTYYEAAAEESQAVTALVRL